MYTLLSRLPHYMKPARTHHYQSQLTARFTSNLRWLLGPKFIAKAQYQSQERLSSEHFQDTFLWKLSKKVRKLGKIAYQVENWNMPSHCSPNP